MKVNAFVTALFSVAQASRVITTAPAGENSTSQVFVARVEDDFDASIGRIWGIYSAFGAAQFYMNNVTFIELEGYGAGAIRNITVLDQYARERLDWVRPESHSLAYTLYDAPGLPAVNVQGTIELSATGANKTQITWTARADSITEGYEESIRDRVLDIYLPSIEKVKNHLAAN